MAMGVEPAMFYWRARRNALCHVEHRLRGSQVNYDAHAPFILEISSRLTVY